jgi:pantetheine-phosphate adenylyltransferase
MRVLFSGSLDPVTNGHLDLIARMVTFADSVVVGVAINPAKQPLFSADERVALLRAACALWPTVVVRCINGLVVDAVHDVRADLLVRGVRDSQEAAQALAMARANRALGGVETLLLPAAPEWCHVSASLVREVARFGGDVSAFVPAAVAARLAASVSQ